MSNVFCVLVIYGPCSARGQTAIRTVPPPADEDSDGDDQHQGDEQQCGDDGWKDPLPSVGLGCTLLLLLLRLLLLLLLLGLLLRLRLLLHRHSLLLLDGGWLGHVALRIRPHFRLDDRLCTGRNVSLGFSISITGCFTISTVIQKILIFKFYCNLFVYLLTVCYSVIYIILFSKCLFGKNLFLITCMGK